MIRHQVGENRSGQGEIKTSVGKGKDCIDAVNPAGPVVLPVVNIELEELEIRKLCADMPATPVDGFGMDVKAAIH